MPLIFYKDSQISCSDKAFSPKKFGGPPDVFGWGFRLEVSSRWQHPEAAAIENTDNTDNTEMADARYRGRSGGGLLLQWGGGAIGDLGALGALGGAR